MGTSSLPAAANYHILDQATATQWSPLAMFLVVFVLGLIVLGWMIQPSCQRNGRKRQSRI